MMKYLGINLTKHTENSHPENYQALIGEVKKSSK